MATKMDRMNERLMQAREKCPGMTEDVYQFAEYLAGVANGELMPTGVVALIVCALDDIQKGRCGFGKATEFPEYFVEYKHQVLAQACYILQVIDAVTDEEFADAVRLECRQCIGWDVPKRVSVEDDEPIPSNVKAAVDWWTEAIQHPKMDNGDDALAMLMANMGGGVSANLSTDQVKAFRSKLAGLIEDELRLAFQPITLDVDYWPCIILAEAANAAGLRGLIFPCKTTMWIYTDEVAVSAGYGAERKTIWKEE